VLIVHAEQDGLAQRTRVELPFDPIIERERIDPFLVAPCVAVQRAKILVEPA
jgi:hypothetical protein